MTKVNLSCGDKRLEGYINCDYSKNLEVDKRFDLNIFPYPFEDNSVDEVLMDNVLEHLFNTVVVMEELHRILRNGGILKIMLPYAKSDWAFQDITHKAFFTERSMDYFTDGFRYNFYSKVRFQIIKCNLTSGNRTIKNKIRNLVPFRSILRYFFWNMYDGIYFELRAIKR